MRDKKKEGGERERERKRKGERDKKKEGERERCRIRWLYFFKGITGAFAPLVI